MIHCGYVFTLQVEPDSGALTFNVIITEQQILSGLDLAEPRLSNKTGG